MKNDSNTEVVLSSMFAALKRQLGEGWTEGTNEPFVVWRKVADGGNIKVRCCTSGYQPIIKVVRFHAEKGIPATVTEFTTLSEALRTVNNLLGA